MKVELIKLELTNYRNISYISYDFKGNSKIVGDNRIGKTNSLEAIVWLLTDKLLNGSSDVQAIKPVGDTRKEVRVEGEFSIWDEHHPEIPPRTIVLRKEYGEDWVKTRGTDVETLKGHYLTYYYNGVKQKTKKDWYSLFNEDFGINVEFKGIDLIQLLTNPFYVGDLGESDSWTDLRAFIIQIIGDVSDEDIYKAQPSTMIIKEELRACGGRLEQLKKQYSNEIKGIKEQLIGDDANVKMLEETPCPSDDEVTVAKKAVEDIDEQLAKLQSDKANESSIVALEKELVERRNELLKIQSECQISDTTSDLSDKLAALNEEYRELLVKKAQEMENLSRARYRVEDAVKTYNECVNYRKNVIEQLRSIDSQLFETFDGICPVCGQPLEGELLEKAQAEKFDSLNKRKDELMELGRKNRAKMDELDAFIKQNIVETIEETIERLKGDIQSKKDEITAVGTQLNEEKSKPREIKETSQVYAYKQVIADLERKIEIAKADINAANAMIREQVNDLYAKKESFVRVLNDYDYAQHQFDRLEDVKAQRNNHRSRLASYEQKSELLNLFMRTKLEMLDERVKTVFGNIKFQLVNVNLKEGSYSPVCKPYIYDVLKGTSSNVTWRNGSKSEKVITGIAIAEAIKSTLGLADFPFLFDEGGEISEDTFKTRFITKSQLICVKVQDGISKPIVMKI